MKKAEGGSARPLRGEWNCRCRGAKYGVFTGYSGKTSHGAIAIGAGRAGAGSCGLVPPPCRAARGLSRETPGHPPGVPGAHPSVLGTHPGMARAHLGMPAGSPGMPGARSGKAGVSSVVPSPFRDALIPFSGCSEPFSACPEPFSGCPEPLRRCPTCPGSRSARSGWVRCGPRRAGAVPRRAETEIFNP